MTKQQVQNNLKLLVILLALIIVARCVFLADQGGWKTQYKGKGGIIADGPEGSVLVGKPKEENNQVVFHINDTYYENTECRVIAIDNFGRIHTGEQKSTLVPEKQYRSTDAIFPNLTLNKIKEFRFQTRKPKQENK